MDKKLTSNYFYSVIYQLLTIITPFITVPYLTRVMGKEILSISDITQNTAQWFVLFGIMGVNIYGSREIARVRDNKKDLSKTFFEIFFMQFLSMLLSFIVFILFYKLSNPKFADILIIQSITLLSVSIDITWFFYGVEDFKKASIRNMFVKIINVVLILLLIKGPQDLARFVILNASLGVIGQLIMWLQLRHYINFEKIAFKGILRHIKPNITLFIPQIAISVYQILDVQMLSILYDKFEVVNVYRQSQNFVKMFLFFITSIGSVMLPRISNTHKKDDVKAINRYLDKTFKLAIYLAVPMIFGIMGVIQNFVDWFFPATYFETGILIKIASPMILFISISNVFGTQYMVPIGDYKHYTISVFIGAITNFLINLALIPSFGAYGAIVGSVIAEFAVTFIQWIFIKDKLNVSISFKEITIILSASVLMGMVTYYMGTLGTGILVNLIQIFVGIAVYALILYIFKAQLFIETISILRRNKNAEA